MEPMKHAWICYCNCNYYSYSSNVVKPDDYILSYAPVHAQARYTVVCLCVCVCVCVDIIHSYIGWTREEVSGWGTLVWLRTSMLAATSDRTTEPMQRFPTNGWPWRVLTMPSSQRKLMW